MGEIIMPTELTAENGAKHVFIGEFHENISLICPECLENGEYDECYVCAGYGEYTQRVTISWTNIKAIYKKAVELLGQTI